MPYRSDALKALLRKDKMVVGDPVVLPGTPVDPNMPLVNSGITGAQIGVGG